MWDKEKRALLEYHEKHGIVTEAYSPLKPLTDPSYQGGPVSLKISAHYSN